MTTETPSSSGTAPKAKAATPAYVWWLVLIGVGFFLGALADKNSTPAAGQTSAGSTVISAPASSDLEPLKKDISSLQLSVATLSAQQNESRHAGVFLDVTQTSYQRIDTDTGTFFVKVKGVEPYLDGQKITLQIGNPSAANYHGFKLHFVWNDSKNAANVLKKDDDSTVILSAGAWTSVSTIVSPASPEELRGSLFLSLETNEISLRN